ncbi:MAG: hypothetical protein ABW168_04300 [Sedimenticola sp.]
MEIPKEITRNKASVAGFAWGVTWRFLIISYGVGWLLEILPIGVVLKTIGIWPTMALQLFLTFAFYWVASYWILQRGFGSTKIVLLEHAHYQEIAKRLKNES